MNMILTDKEIDNIFTRWGAELGYKYERAVEAAVLAKLAQQSPDIEPDEAFELGLERIAYYAHPAPQQADRQRVPDGWKLVPVEPTAEMVRAIGIPGSGLYEREVWAAMLAAAPEAPAQASAVDERAAFEVWAKGFYRDVSRLAKYQTGDYKDDDVHDNWQAWQARAALAQKGDAR